jgi:hypothetical protein
MHADAPRSFSALDAASVRSGAVVSFSDDSLVVGGETIVGAIEEQLTARAARPEPRDQWLLPMVPALRRGSVWIVPLSWEPTDAAADTAAVDGLASRATDLRSSVRSACWYRAGEAIGVDLAPDSALRPYAAELVRIGARTALWWGFDDSAVVLVVSGRDESLTAIHVVPLGWVSDRKPSKKVPPMDLTWSWADVVALAHREAASAADSLSVAEDEGQNS